MELNVRIPEEIANELKLPEVDADSALRKEVAYALYARGIASFGPARRLAGISKWEFIEGLRDRQISRQFDESEWEQELAVIENGGDQ